MATAPVMRGWVRERAAVVACRRRATSRPFASSPTPCGGSCSCTATGCSGRCRTLRTWSRRRCSAPGGGWGASRRRASVRSWLYRIATNRCLNALRDASRRPPAGGRHPLYASTAHPRGRADLARALPRRAARGADRHGTRARRPLRDPRDRGAGVHRRAPGASSAPAGGTRAPRRARLPRLRGRRAARQQRGLRQERPQAGPREPWTSACQAGATRLRCRSRRRSASWWRPSPTPGRSATSTGSCRC